MAPEVIGSLVSAGGSLLEGSLGQGFNVSNMKRQADISKDLMRYQWNNFSSPAAQIASLNKAGLGVNAYLGGKGSAGVPSGGMPSSAPIAFDGIADLGNIASYVQSVAQAKKAGMDTKLSEEEIKNKEIERQRNEFELDLRKQFGKDVQTADLANAYMNLILASDQSDLNEIQKAIGKWNEIKAEAEAKTSEHNRDIMKQVLDNNPTALRLENRLKELQGSAAAASAEESIASAKVARASAEQTEIFNKIYSDQRFKHSMITQAVESGRQAVEARKLTKSQADHMNYMVQQAAYATDMQEFTYWSNQIQSFVHSVGEGVSSFYGAGALKELIKLRQMQNAPVNPVRGFAP